MNSGKVHRKISLRRKIFQYLLFTTFFSLTLLGSFWIESEVKNFNKEILVLKNTYSENQKLEIKTKILEIKDWIYWIRSHPPESVTRIIPGFTNDLFRNSDHFNKLLQEYCLDSLSRIRFTKDEYIFINSLEGKALVSNGKYNIPPVNILTSGDTAWIRIFKIEQLAAIKEQGFFYTYSFKKISALTTSLKTSYFSYLPEWNWIIGTGSYEDDFNSIIELKRRALFSGLRKNLFNFTPFLLISFLISYLIVLFFSKRLAKNITIFKDFFTKAVVQHNLIDNSQVSYNEFEVLAETANKMIVESLKAEASLKISEEKYRFLFERNPASMLIYDRNTFKILSVNEAFVKHYGYSTKEIATMLLQDLFPDDEKTAIIELAKGLHGHAYAGEWHHIKKDGSQITTIATSHDIKFLGRNARVAVIIDITERKNAEEELKLHREHLEELVIQRTAELEKEKEHAQSADRLKSAFLATMSHELRTPLNSIIGFTGILMQERPGPLNEEQKKQLGMAQNSARHLLSLINDVLDISKIEAGQLKMNLRKFNLPEAIYKVIETNKPFADKKNLRIIVEIGENIQEIVSDNLRIQQILLNLLNNAIKFTEVGQISIKCFSSGNFVKIQIADTGIGIESEKIEQLFKPFIQIDTGLTRKHEGTGLGLSICKKLTEMLNGQIEVESKFGVGSTFTVTLPILNT
jgi:PAS domain S-box-containing protein